MNASIFFRVVALMLLAGLFTLLAWWNLPGPATTAFVAMLVIVFSLAEDAHR